jgi:hypothetical protein
MGTLVLHFVAASSCSHVDTDAPNTHTAEGRLLDVTLNVTTSVKIATVAIVEVALRRDAELDSLELRYGVSSDALNKSVQVNVHSTVGAPHVVRLLGLKQNTHYVVQAVAISGGRTERSAAVSFSTGVLTQDLPSVTTVDVRPDALYGGFTIVCTGAATNQSVVMILDSDGEYVWAYPIADTPVESCSRARMSYDGRWMWVGNVNFLTSIGALMRIPMDGLGEPQSFALPGRHHDFAILPNGHVAYFSQANGGGLDGGEKHDVIYELDAETGEVIELYDQTQDFAALIGSDIAHTNYISYVPELKALSFSLREANTIGVISYPNGELLAKFGGAESSFPAMSWSVQHGHHLFEDRLFVFSNLGTNGELSGSRVLGYSYDRTTGASELTLEYLSGNTSVTFGEVRQLPNGNLLVTYSNSGTIHEITAHGELLRELRIGSVGYVEHQRSLYGPPPPYGD